MGLAEVTRDVRVMRGELQALDLTKEVFLVDKAEYEQKIETSTAGLRTVTDQRDQNRALLKRLTDVVENVTGKPFDFGDISVAKAAVKADAAAAEAAAVAPAAAPAAAAAAAAAPAVPMDTGPDGVKVSGFSAPTKSATSKANLALQTTYAVPPPPPCRSPIHAEVPRAEEAGNDAKPMDSS